jgi:hypothetical protein
VAAAAVAGCGGSERSAGDAPTTARVETEAATPRSPTLACDVVAVCLPEIAHETLERCPANQLSRHGRLARRRLENALAHIEDVDLHNKLADLAPATALAALTELEKACA